MASIADHKAALSGTEFILRADIDALAQMELDFDRPWLDVLVTVGPKMKIDDVAKVFAALGKSNHPDLTPDAVKAAMADMSGYRDAVNAINAAFEKGKPQRDEAAEVAEDAPADPPFTPSWDAPPNTD